MTLDYAHYEWPLVVYSPAVDSLRLTVGALLPVTPAIARVKDRNDLLPWKVFMTAETEDGERYTVTGSVAFRTHSDAANHVAWLWRYKRKEAA